MVWIIFFCVGFRNLIFATSKFFNSQWEAPTYSVTRDYLAMLKKGRYHLSWWDQSARSYSQRTSNQRLAYKLVDRLVANSRNKAKACYKKLLKKLSQKIVLLHVSYFIWGHLSLWRDVTLLYIKYFFFLSLQPGSIWVDHSTTDFNQNYEFSKQAAAKEAHILEAPITGGLEALKKGQMAVWVSCVNEHWIDITIQIFLKAQGAKNKNKNGETSDSIFKHSFSCFLKCLWKTRPKIIQLLVYIFVLGHLDILKDVIYGCQ